MTLSAILSNKICNQIGYSPYWQLQLNDHYDNYREILPLQPSPRWPCGSARCGRVAVPLATLSSGPQYSCTSQTWRARMASALPPKLPDRNSRFSHEITKFGSSPPSSNLVPRSPRFVFLYVITGWYYNAGEGPDLPADYWTLSRVLQGGVCKINPK